MSTKTQLTSPLAGISCHAWNADFTQCAISPNSNEIHIYNVPSSGAWRLAHTLSEHDMYVSGLDWSHATNQIVSCSHDRSAFVWTFDEGEGKWMPALVLLRTDLACLSAQWSPDGKRFSVTSSCKKIPVCYHDTDEGTDWWISRIVKKVSKSSVTSSAFNPKNSQILAVGSCDHKMKIISVYISEVDGGEGVGFPFSKQGKFGDVHATVSATSWVNDISWCPDGKSVCFATQEACIYVFNAEVGTESIIRSRDLPYTSVLFAGSDSILGVGHEYKPSSYLLTGDKWTFNDYLDKKKEKKQSDSSSGFAASRNLFQSKATRGQDKVDEKLWTKHDQNVTQMKVAGQGRVSTVGNDGSLVVWDVATLGVNLGNLSI